MNPFARKLDTAIRMKTTNRIVGSSSWASCSGHWRLRLGQWLCKSMQCSSHQSTSLILVFMLLFAVHFENNLKQCSTWGSLKFGLLIFIVRKAFKLNYLYLGIILELVCNFPVKAKMFKCCLVTMTSEFDDLFKLQSSISRIKLNQIVKRKRIEWNVQLEANKRGSFSSLYVQPD